MIVGVIQARMGSTRLPGKVLAPILGQPMVWRIFERMSHSQYLDQVVIATTTDLSDDKLVRFAEEHGIKSYRGSVDDLVERLWGAAHYFNADILVRIWGDCPFADPKVIDQAVEKLITEKLDYVSSAVLGKRTFPAGLDLEVYRKQTLNLIRENTQDEFYREFPAEYVVKHSSQFRSGVIFHDKNLSHIYLTVDYPQDLELARLIYAKLYRANKVFHLKEILDMMQNHSDALANVVNLPRNIEYHQKRKEYS